MPLAPMDQHKHSDQPDDVMAAIMADRSWRPSRPLIGAFCALIVGILIAAGLQSGSEGKGDRAPASSQSEPAGPSLQAELERAVNLNRLLRDVAYEPTLGAPLRAMLGTSFDRFMERTGTAAPMAEAGQYIVATGCKPHFCSSDTSYLEVHRPTGEMFAVIIEEAGPLEWFSNRRVAPPLDALERYFGVTPYRSGGSATLTVSDVLIDGGLLDGRHVLVHGSVRASGEDNFMRDSPSANGFLIVEGTQLSRADRKRLLNRCDRYCEVAVYGRVTVTGFNTKKLHASTIVFFDHPD